MFKALFRRIALGDLAPEHRATHATFRPDRFALVQLPDRCPVCIEPGVISRTLQGVEWVGVAHRGGFDEVRRGTLPAKSVFYCAEHAPSDEPPPDEAQIPGIKVAATTENGFLKEVIVESENLEWMDLLLAASRWADEEAQRRQVDVDRARLRETIGRMPGWTLGPCRLEQDNLWHASAIPSASSSASPTREPLETTALNEAGALNALANMLERQAKAER